MNSRPGPLEGLAMLAAGTAVLALAFASQADVPSVDLSRLFERAPDPALAAGEPTSEAS
jgi:hypothetical protein